MGVGGGGCIIVREGGVQWGGSEKRQEQEQIGRCAYHF
jgi:hypothetical protein